MERRQQVLPHAVDEIAAIDEILLAQREQVAAVGPLGCRGQAEQELRTEVGDQLAVGRRGGVVELVDDDVVERVWREPLQVLAPAQRLDRGEHDLGVRVLDLAGVVAKPRLRADAAEGVERLVEDLLAVGDEQHAAELRPAGVERREPGLAETSRQDDQPGLVAGRPRVLQRAAARPAGPRSARLAAFGASAATSAASTIGRWMVAFGDSARSTARRAASR